MESSENLDTGPIYTVTMAQLYADQGHFKRAIEIYQFLLSQNPGREDLQEALATLEERASRHVPESKDALIPLFAQWIRLIGQYKHLHHLRQLKNELKS